MTQLERAMQGLDWKQVYDEYSSPVPWDIEEPVKEVRVEPVTDRRPPRKKGDNISHLRSSAKNTILRWAREFKKRNDKNENTD